MSATLGAILMAADDPVAIDLQALQRRRKLALWGMFVLIFLPALSISSWWWPAAKVVDRTIEWIGIVALFMCIFGRSWCTLYIGSRKKRELVMLGPYSVCRNPLYGFTVLGAFGVGAQYGSLTMAISVAALTFLVFYRVVKHEEAFLADTFGHEFARYAARVPAFLPRFSGWRDAPQLNVRPRLVIQTFFDATLFLLSIPAAELLEALQRQGALPVLLRLP